MFGFTFWLVLLVLGIVGTAVAAILTELRVIREDQPGYYPLVVLLALALGCGIIGAVVHADDGPKGECRQRDGVPTQVGRGWVCLAPGTVR